MDYTFRPPDFSLGAGRPHQIWGGDRLINSLPTLEFRHVAWMCVWQAAVMMVKNGAMVATVWAESIPYWASASNVAVLQLDKSDQVWLMLLSRASYLHGYMYTTFSGFLIFWWRHSHVWLIVRRRLEHITTSCSIRYWGRRRIRRWNSGTRPPPPEKKNDQSAQNSSSLNYFWVYGLSFSL